MRAHVITRMHASAIQTLEKVEFKNPLSRHDPMTYKVNQTTLSRYTTPVLLNIWNNNFLSVGGHGIHFGRSPVILHVINEGSVCALNI